MKRKTERFRVCHVHAGRPDRQERHMLKKTTKMMMMLRKKNEAPSSGQVVQEEYMYVKLKKEKKREAYRELYYVHVFAAADSFIALAAAEL